MKDVKRPSDIPWRKRWPGSPCMKLHLRDADGSEVWVEADLSPAMRRRALSLLRDSVKPKEKPDGNG